jgi:hypothetical protein
MNWNRFLLSTKWSRHRKRFDKFWFFFSVKTASFKYPSFLVRFCRKYRRMALGAPTTLFFLARLSGTRLECYSNRKKMLLWYTRVMSPERMLRDRMSLFSLRLNVACNKMSSPNVAMAKFYNSGPDLFTSGLFWGLRPDGGLRPLLTQLATPILTLKKRSWWWEWSWQPAAGVRWWETGVINPG